MKTEKSNNGLIGMGLLTAIASSLCCITPVLALFAGSSGMAASFSWMEPARPYLIGFTVLVLGFAWYMKLKPQKADVDCDCEENEKTSFWQSKKFLGIVTVFAVLMTAFPYYSGIFFPDTETTDINIVNENDIVEANLIIDGMTCEGCEHSVDYSLANQDGVIEAKSSYDKGIAKVKFDDSKVSLEELVAALERETGYSVVEKTIIN